MIMFLMILILGVQVSLEDTPHRKKMFILRCRLAWDFWCNI